ncbi:hypothetical protein GGI42DRAFT_243693 [Trichoderma sp. SZMC 28013]
MSRKLSATAAKSSPQGLARCIFIMASLGCFMTLWTFFAWMLHRWAWAWPARRQTPPVGRRIACQMMTEPRESLDDERPVTKKAKAKAKAKRKSVSRGARLARVVSGPSALLRADSQAADPASRMRRLSRQFAELFHTCIRSTSIVITTTARIPGE